MRMMLENAKKLKPLYREERTIQLLYCYSYQSATKDKLSVLKYDKLSLVSFDIWWAVSSDAWQAVTCHFWHLSSCHFWHMTGHHLSPVNFDTWHLSPINFDTWHLSPDIWHLSLVIIWQAIICQTIWLIHTNLCYKSPYTTIPEFSSIRSTINQHNVYQQ